MYFDLYPKMHVGQVWKMKNNLCCSAWKRTRFGRIVFPHWVQWLQWFKQLLSFWSWMPLLTFKYEQVWLSNKYFGVENSDIFQEIQAGWPDTYQKKALLDVRYQRCESRAWLEWSRFQVVTAGWTTTQDRYLGAWCFFSNKSGTWCSSQRRVCPQILVPSPPKWTESISMFLI